MFAIVMWAKFESLTNAANLSFLVSFMALATAAVYSFHKLELNK